MLFALVVMQIAFVVVSEFAAIATFPWAQLKVNVHSMDFEFTFLTEALVAWDAFIGKIIDGCCMHVSHVGSHILDDFPT